MNGTGWFAVLRGCGAADGGREGATRGVIGEMTGSVGQAAFLASVVAASSAAAQEASEVSLDATYLAAPTDWCPANAGVPMAVKMDGPDIINGPKEFPRRVRVNKGGRISEVYTGEDTDSLNNSDDLAGPNAEVIGRFSAEFQGCLSAWSTTLIMGTWHLSGSDGSDKESGSFENERLFGFDLPLFRRVNGPSKARYAQFGDHLLFSAGDPKVTITQKFLAEPDKE
jgi:hypothetical protein